MASANVNIKFLADLQQFSTQMQNAERQIKKMGRDLKKTGKNLSVGITAPVVALGTLSVKTFADFEQGMAKVAAISGATGSQFKALEDNAKKLGASTRFTASQVAQLQLNYSKLGFSPDEILNVTEATLDLALATGEDLADSATIAAGTMRSFQIASEDSQRVIDVMAQSFSSSALDLNKFSTAMGTIGPVANALGQSLEQTTAQLGVLVDNNIDASTAGTMLRNMMLSATEDGFSMEEALREIAGSTDQASTALQFFDKRAVATAIVLANNIEKVQGLTDKLEGSEGAAKSMAGIMDNTLQGSLAKLQSAAEGLGIEFGQVLKPFVEDVAGALADLATKFAQLDPEVKKVITVIGGLAAVIGPLMVTLGFMMTNVIPGLITAFAGMTKGVTVAATAVKGLSASMAGISAVVGGVAAAIAAIGYAFTALVQKYLTPAVSKLETFWNLLKSGGNTTAFINAQLESNAKALFSQEKAQEEVNKDLQAANDLLDEAAKKLDNVNKKAPTAPSASRAAASTLKQYGTDYDVQSFNYTFDESDQTIDQSEIEAQMERTTISMTEKQERMLAAAVDFKNKMSETIQQAAVDFAASIGEMVGSLVTGEANFQDVGKKLLAGFGSILVQFGKLVIAAGVASEAFQKAITNPFGGGIGAIIAGTALVAIGAAMKSFAKSAPALADGGIAFGPTLAYVGEYSNARANPEVIAPLDKLRSLINPAGSNVTVNGVWEMDGRMMRLVLDNADQQTNRLS